MSNPKVRELNGYRLIYSPDHPSSMKNDNWLGWVYEHIFVAESYLKRQLLPNEVVHHLDCDPKNNHITNLLVLDKGQHRKLHDWLDRGAPVCESYRGDGVNSGKPKTVEQTSSKECKFCRDIFVSKNKSVVYCSHSCSSKDRRVIERPSKTELENLVWKVPKTLLAKTYNVSNTTISKWCKQLDISFPPRGYWSTVKAILKQAE